MDLKLESAGLSDVLTSGAVADLVLNAALDAAAAAEAAYPTPHSDGPVNVDVDTYTASGGRLRGQRAAAALVATHPAALGFEAKHGVLIKAARSAGLEVKRR